jgi:hypothetical protein
MTDESEEGQHPEEDFEIVEIDVTPFLTEEQKKWPIVESEYPEEDFAIEEVLPVLVLTPALVHGTGCNNGSPAGDRVAAFVEAVSAYE